MEIESYSYKAHTNQNQLFIEVVLNSAKDTVYKETYCITHKKEFATVETPSRPPTKWNPNKGWRNVFQDEKDKISINGFYVRKNEQVLAFLKRFQQGIQKFIGFPKAEILRMIQELFADEELINFDILMRRLDID